MQHQEQEIDYAHRHDYYMFLFVERGSAKMLIDFEEKTIIADSVYYILPEQVHLLTEHSNDASAWMLAIDSSLIEIQFKEIFDNNSPFEIRAELSKNVISELTQLISILSRRINTDLQDSGRKVIHNISSAYISIIAEAYKESATTNINKRALVITSQFKSLLSKNYRNMKSPSEYANALNMSSAYLNEVVKDATGITVSEYIRNEIIIRAKRLLYYTNMSIKDIAIDLGYEDWAYFSRIFSKATNMSPTDFRAKYRE